LELGATIGPGNLIGHEGLVMDAECGDSDPKNVEVVEPERTSEVRLAPQTQALQLFWYALRWVLDGRLAVWKRVKQILSGQPADRMPAVVSFFGARGGLGTTALAYGTGAALAREGRTVIVDLQGSSNFDTRWKKQGFKKKRCRKLVHPGIRAQYLGDLAERNYSWWLCDYFQLEPPAKETSVFQGIRELDIVWPAPPPRPERSLNAAAAEKLLHDETLLEVDDAGPAPPADDAGGPEMLLEVMEADLGVRHVIVTGHDALTREMNDRLAGRLSTVFYVSDDPDRDYPSDDSNGNHRGLEPEHLTPSDLRAG
jgi:hypothetical protein